MSSDFGKQLVTENIYDKISCLIWTEINSMRIKHYIYIHVSLHVLSGMNLAKFTNNAVFSKTGKQF